MQTVAENQNLTIAPARIDAAAVLPASFWPLAVNLLTTLVPEVLFQAIIDQLAGLAPCDSAAIFIRAGDALQLAASRGYGTEAGNEQTPLTGADLAAIHQLALRQTPRVIADRAAALSGALPGGLRPALLAALIDASMGSGLAVPLRVKDNLLGILCLGRREAGDFDPAAIQLVQAFANAAAIAITNADHFRQAQDRAAAQERIRLSHLLHDGVVQTLFSANLIANALDALLQRDLSEAQREIEKLRRLIQGATAQSRDLLLDLRPDRLVREELGQLIDDLCQSASAQAGFAIQAAIDAGCDLPAEPKLALYRISQEALVNVVKHAGASEITVALTCHAGGARISIRDNGCGFDPQTVAGSHLGLRIMRERAAEVGAVFNISSAAGNGTQIVVNWPAPQP